jgi:hypothetical protein
MRVCGMACGFAAWAAAGRPLSPPSPWNGGLEAASSETEERQELGEIDQPLGLESLLRAELLALVLAIEQLLETSIDTPRQREGFEARGDLHLEDDGLGHVRGSLDNRRRP